MNDIKRTLIPFAVAASILAAAFVGFFAFPVQASEAAADSVLEWVEIVPGTLTVYQAESTSPEGKTVIAKWRAQWAKVIGGSVNDVVAFDEGVFYTTTADNDSGYWEAYLDGVKVAEGQIPMESIRDFLDATPEVKGIVIQGKGKAKGQQDI